jgi:hypothetical protein
MERGSVTDVQSVYTRAARAIGRVQGVHTPRRGAHLHAPYRPCGFGEERNA